LKTHLQPIGCPPPGITLSETVGKTGLKNVVFVGMDGLPSIGNSIRNV